MRIGAAVISLAFLVSAIGCSPYDHHVPEPRPKPAPPCTGMQPERHRPTPGYPGLVYDDTWYGGTASWTHDGDPPAGDHCAWPPGGVRPR